MSGGGGGSTGDNVSGDDIPVLFSVPSIIGVEREVFGDKLFCSSTPLTSGEDLVLLTTGWDDSVVRFASLELLPPSAAAPPLIATTVDLFIFFTFNFDGSFNNSSSPKRKYNCAFCSFTMVEKMESQ